MLLGDVVVEAPRDRLVRVDAILWLLEEATSDEAELLASDTADPRKDAVNDGCELGWAPAI